MSYAGESADEFMRFTMDGAKVVAQITGAGAKQLLALMLAILNDKKETIGKTKLKNMLKSGKELKVFTIREEDLKTFQKNAKRYGISYTALVDRKNKTKDGIVDILVKAEDAPRINRIVERFSLMVDETAKIRTEVQKAIEDRNKKEQEEKQKNDDLPKEKNGIENKDENAKPVIQDGQEVSEVVKKEVLTIREKRAKKLQKEAEKEKAQKENFTEAKMEEGHLSEPKSNKLKNETLTTKMEIKNRPSVREHIKEIKRDMAKKQEAEMEREKSSIKKKNKTHQRNSGKHYKNDEGKHMRTSRARNDEKTR